MGRKFYFFPRSHAHRQSKRHFRKKKKMGDGNWEIFLQRRFEWANKDGKMFREMNEIIRDSVKKRVVSLARWQMKFRRLFSRYLAEWSSKFLFLRLWSTFDEENLVEVYFKISYSIKHFICSKGEKWLKCAQIESFRVEKHPEIRFFSYA